MVWREWRKLYYSVHGMSPEIFFWISVSAISEWEMELDLGSDSWGQMRRKIPISLGKCWTKSSLENYKSSWSELAVSFLHVTYSRHANWLLLQQGKEVWGIFI